jgi:hypothetical protein
MSGFAHKGDLDYIKTAMGSQGKALHKKLLSQQPEIVSLFQVVEKNPCS